MRGHVWGGYERPPDAAPRMIDDLIARSAGHALAAFDDGR
jgi:hypothetical protein